MYLNLSVLVVFCQNVRNKWCLTRLFNPPSMAHAAATNKCAAMIAYKPHWMRSTITSHHKDEIF